jgi:hypothetical protein
MARYRYFQIAEKSTVVIVQHKLSEDIWLRKACFRACTKRVMRELRCASRSADGVIQCLAQQSTAYRTFQSLLDFSVPRAGCRRCGYASLQRRIVASASSLEDGTNVGCICTSILGARMEILMFCSSCVSSNSMEMTHCMRDRCIIALNCCSLLHCC